jgi:hypothetical protein
MKGILKWPLIIAAILVAAGVVLERLGAPFEISNKVSVSVLLTLIVPLYLAWRISASTATHPYRDLLKGTIVYAALVRAMVAVTYWLAYIYQWPEPRFREENAGVVGPGVTPVEVLLVPLVLALSWIIGAIIIGGGLGSLLIAIRRRSSRAVAS